MSAQQTRRQLLQAAAACLGTGALAHAPTGAAAQVLGPKPAPAARITDIKVSARRIDAFERGGTGRRRFGRLDFRGGLVLSSDSPEFGGWSGVTVDPDGRRLAMVSDAGSWLTGEIAYEAGRPTGIRQARIGPLRATSGGPLSRGRDRDAEDIVMLDGTIAAGTALVAFEQNHRIARMPVGDGGPAAPTSLLKRPADWPRMRPNEGIEALAVIRGGPAKGAVVAFAERLLDARRNHTGWIWPKGPDGDAHRLNLTNIGDFSITGAASLPDGSLVVLERYFRWTEGVKMRLRLVPAAQVKSGALLTGESLLEADLAYEIDNMEGLAVHRGPAGEAILTLISDDNFNHFLQRTVLLQFALDGTQKTAAPR